jgi:hypothetical protein
MKLHIFDFGGNDDKDVKSAEGFQFPNVLGA